MSQEPDVFAAPFNRSLYQNAQHFLSREHHRFSFSSEHAPAITISPGELIHVQTWDCYKGLITNAGNALAHIDDSNINPATGPIYVTGAEPGDTLSVILHDIKPLTRGVARTYPGNGQLQHFLTKPYARFFEVVDGKVTMNERVSFPSIGEAGKEIRSFIVTFPSITSKNRAYGFVRKCCNWPFPG